MPGKREIRMAKTVHLAELKRTCAAIAGQMGYELTEVCLEKENTGKYLRFYIDRPEGITLDDCEAYHKAVRPLAEPVDFDFMEVSSPGIDRPLRKDRDFERHVGDEVEVRLYRPLDGRKVLAGVLADWDRGEILLETPERAIRVSRKDAALIRPVVHLEGIEDVDLSGDGEAGTTITEE